MLADEAGTFGRPAQIGAAAMAAGTGFGAGAGPSRTSVNGERRSPLSAPLRGDLVDHISLSHCFLLLSGPREVLY